MAAGAGRGVPGAELPPSLSLRVTNGGKTTLTRKLMQALPNCSVVHQDDFFKVRRGAGGGWSRLGLGAAAGGGGEWPCRWEAAELARLSGTPACYLHAGKPGGGLRFLFFSFKLQFFCFWFFLL